MIIIENTIHLSEERARRLQDLAVETGSSEDSLIEKALDAFFDLCANSGGSDEFQGWSGLSLKSQEKVWDNDADAAYDDWRELYALPDR